MHKYTVIVFNQQMAQFHWRGVLNFTTVIHSDTNMVIGTSIPSTAAQQVSALNNR